MGLKSLTSLDIRNFDTSKVTTMRGMFSYCGSLTELDVTNFNTDKVEDMCSMFDDCTSLSTLDVSNFNTSKVQNISYMFNTLNIETLDISNFDTRNVTDFARMFNNSSLLKNIYVGENWNTEKNVGETIYVFPVNCNLPNFNKSNDSYRDLKWAYVGEGGYLSTKPTE